MDRSGWVHAGGALGVGIHFEYRDEQGRLLGRAYVCGDETGRPTVVGFDLDPAAEKRRDELERTLRDELRPLAQRRKALATRRDELVELRADASGREDETAQLVLNGVKNALKSVNGERSQLGAVLCGITSSAVRSRRGPKARPDRARRFAADVHRDGYDAALEAWGLRDRTGRGLMTKAAEQGYGRVVRTPGSGNRYVPQGNELPEEAATNGMAHGDVHRSAALRLEAHRSAVAANWERRRGEPPITVEQARAARRAVRDRAARRAASDR